MGVYRVEIAKTGRAGCKNADCKKSEIKIDKGALRMATLVTIKENQSWQYRHWGCVTPRQLENIKESIDGDVDMLDGYDEIPPDLQEKIKAAIDIGHVNDDDWNGDIEQNRPGSTRFRTPKGKKTKGGDDAKDEEASASPTKLASKKHADTKAAKNAEASGTEAPVSKKRARLQKLEQSEHTEKGAPPPKRRGRAKKEVKDEEEAEVVVEHPAKKIRPSRKAAAKKTIVSDESADETDAEITESPKAVPKSKRGQKQKTDNIANVKKKVAKRREKVPDSGS